MSRRTFLRLSALAAVGMGIPACVPEGTARTSSGTKQTLKDYFGPSDFRGRWSADRRILYDKRSSESWRAMSIGTGTTGAAVWVPKGIMLQIGHTDAWASDAALPTLARVQIDLEGDPFANASSYEQVLDLNEAAIKIKAETADGPVSAVIIAHPDYDVIQIEITDERSSPGRLTVTPIYWRQYANHTQTQDKVFIVELNTVSGFNELNENMGVSGDFGDPLLYRRMATGIWVQGIKPQAGAFREERPLRKKRVLVAAYAGFYPAHENVVPTGLVSKMQAAESVPLESFTNSHKRWWADFWTKSAFELDESSALQPARAVWHLQRYYAASTMQGAFPPKFNGSIFLYNYDQRPWRGPYWFQNMRLLYWPLFRTGDIDYLPQFFDMYIDALDYVRAWVKQTWNHEGAAFIETMHFWGAGRWRDVAPGEGVVNDYIKDHWEGSLELLMMMLEYDRYKGDSAFAREKLIPLAEELISFFFEHYPIRNGKLFIERASALETWWEADNPADQIAGLRAVIPGVIAVGEREGVDVSRFKAWLPLVPDLPRGMMNVTGDQWHYEWAKPGEGTDFLPALAVHDRQKHNWEDPELYALWPFNLYGLGMPEYEAMLSTYRNRLNPEPRWGWSQTAIWAARLGLAEEAAQLLRQHFAFSATLPGGMMSSPGSASVGRQDIPGCAYFDAIGAIAMTVNEMLVQDHTGQVVLRPAWPEDEPVSFKLHTPSGVVSQP
jgi:hypothetical protein